jgi:long-chain fatty acid transport protein
MTKRPCIIRHSCTATIIVTMLHVGTVTPVDGVSLSGAGIRAEGMGVTSFGFPLDSSAPADNTAGMQLIDSRISLGVQVIEPQSEYQYGNAFDTLQTRKIHPAPDGGNNRQIDPRITFGVSLFNVACSFRTWSICQ